MIRTIGCVTQYVSNLDHAVDWYFAVFGLRPTLRTQLLTAFSATRDSDIILLAVSERTDGPAAVFFCDDLDSELVIWRTLAGVVESEYLFNYFPARMVILRDPDHNCVIILESKS